VYRLLGQYEIVTWWASSVEIRSGLERLLRMGHLTSSEYSSGETRLDRLRVTWIEVRPDDAVRSEAEALLHRFPLSAADALQLSAAISWTDGKPRGGAFICADARLLDAAKQMGFHAIEA
jgi:predicted nucleic acid-binding protein